ncbi:hypothetical protein GCM10017784_34750 [Deinococcus indicus]|nr:hypothetical protein [Deinococcus indicus]GHG37448.1 hypothetical protein GCM10017784_34750 [Deinococcus indicus]
MDENTTVMVELDEQLVERAQAEADANGVTLNDVLLKYVRIGLSEAPEEE